LKSFIKPKSGTAEFARLDNAVHGQWRTRSQGGTGQCRTRHWRTK